MPQLQPIFYIGITLFIILLGFGMWIHYTDSGKIWLSQLEQRVERMQYQNRKRKMPTFKLDPKRSAAFTREMRIARINSLHDTIRDSYQKVIRNPEKLAVVLEGVEKSRQKRLEEIDNTP